MFYQRSRLSDSIAPGNSLAVALAACTDRRTSVGWHRLLESPAPKGWRLDDAEEPGGRCKVRGLSDL